MALKDFCENIISKKIPVSIFYDNFKFGSKLC